MMAFLDVELVSGAEAVLRLLHFEEFAARASLIVTGEGCLDASSAHGKVPAAVLAAGRRHNVPVVAICGRSTSEVAEFGFSQVLEVSSRHVSLSEAMNTATTLANVQHAAAALAKTL